MMKRIFALIALFFGLTLPAISAAAPPLEGWMAQFNLFGSASPAPDTTVFDENAKAITLQKFKGKVVLVNFWATWCAPCIREMPSLDRLAAALKNEKFEVLAVNEDRGGLKKAKPFLEKLEVKNLTLLIDKKMALARALKLRGMPTSYLVDRQGRVVGELAGLAEWDAPEAIAMIRYYLNKK